MKQRACARSLLLLLVGAAVAHAVTITKTNRDDESMPAVPVNEEDKPKGGFYEPFGQAPIAVAHSLQLPCGNKFLMMVSTGDPSSRMSRGGLEVTPTVVSQGFQC